VLRRFVELTAQSGHANMSAVSGPAETI